MAKIRPAWIIMGVNDIRQFGPRLLELVGPILSSNFIAPKDKFAMPVLADPMDAVDVGDVIKLTYFTTDIELSSFLSGESSGFGDCGLRYERKGPDGWDLLYEDFDS